MKQRNYGWRKIDTWKHSFPHPTDRRASLDIEFEVSMSNDCEFTVATDDIPAERFTPLRGMMLADLRDQAKDMAMAERDIRQQLSWSQWLAIRVGSADVTRYSKVERESMEGGQVMLSYQPIARAETPDGKAFTPVETNPHVLTAFPTNAGVRDVEKERKAMFEAAGDAASNGGSADELIRKLNAMERRDGNYQYIYLPDTPQTREGLDAIIARIRDLNQQMHAFLAPEAIESTLVRALQGSGLPMLGQDPKADKTTPHGAAPETTGRRGPGR